MPTQAVVCSIAIAPGKPPAQVDPIKFQGSPVNAWPRAHSAAVHTIANRKSLAAPGNRSQPAPTLRASSAEPIYNANAAGNPTAAIGTSHQNVAMSTNRAAAIQ